MAKKTLLLIAMISLVLCGCANVKDFVQTILKKPEVSLEDVTFQDMTLLQGTAVFHIRITNPNPMGATVDRIVYNLTLDEREFLKGDLAEGVQIKANGSEVIDLPVTVNYLDLFQTFKNFARADKVDYHLFGSVNIGPVNIPYSKRGDFRVPKPPEISLRNVRVTSLSLAGATVTFSLDLKNKNPFSIALKEIRYRIGLGGTEFAGGKAQSVPSVTENGMSTVDIPVNVNFLSLGVSAYNLLKKKSSIYELTGEMKIDIPEVGVKSFPFKKTGEVPIGR